MIVRGVVPVVLTALLVACTEVEGPPTLAIVHATVIDGTGAPPSEDRTLILRGDRIEEIGPSADVAVPSGVTVVDATGLP